MSHGFVTVVWIALGSELRFLHQGSRYFRQKFPTLLVFPRTIPAARYKAPRDRAEHPNPTADQTLFVRFDGSTGQVEHSPKYRLEFPDRFLEETHARQCRSHT